MPKSCCVLNCNTLIQPSEKMCRKHKAQERAGKKHPRKGRRFGADGKVRVGQGLAHWKQLDKKRWEERMKKEMGPVVLAIGKFFQALAQNAEDWKVAA